VKKFLLMPKKCYTEKFTVARIPTPRPTPKPLETTFHECLKKTAKAITDVVPTYKLHKNDGVKNNNIADGGKDMYDAGNQLYIKYSSKEFHGLLKYNQLCQGQFANAGVGDVEYFTCKETMSKGDIFFAGFISKNKKISEFSTGGGTGADNMYRRDGYNSWIDGELKPFKHGRYGRWWAYRKSMAFSQTDYKPSINHLIFVPNKNWEHDWPRDNNQNRRRVWATDNRRRRLFTTDPDWHETRADGANDWVSHILYVMWGGQANNQVIRYDQAQIEKIISKVNMACQ